MADRQPKWINELRSALTEGAERTRMSIEQKRETARLMRLAFFAFSHRARELVAAADEESNAIWSDSEISALGGEVANG